MGVSEIALVDEDDDDDNFSGAESEAAPVSGQCPLVPPVAAVWAVGPVPAWRCSARFGQSRPGHEPIDRIR
eukprot:gene1132-1774_t